MSSVVEPATLRALPKVELHCHLEGSIRSSTLVELADSHQIALPARDPDLLYRYDDLAGFLAVYELACTALVTADDFARVTYESLEDASTTSNVCYREMFFNPTLHPGVPYVEMLTGITAGLRDAETDFGIATRLIPSIYRQMTVGAALEMLAEIVGHRNDHVIGIGMDGDELRDPPERFAEVYAEAARAGLRRTAHVAHDGPAAFITTCLDVLGCERIDHGYHVIDDPAVLARCRDEGIAFLCATPTPPLCGWPPGLDDSPIRTMINAGLTVILNSDDPSMLHTNLGDEFVKVCSSWMLAPARVKQFILDSCDASWLDPTDRRDLSLRLSTEIDAMLDPVTT